MSEGLPTFTPRKEVDADEKGKKPFEEGVAARSEKTPTELESYQEEGQQFLDSYDRFFKTYAKDVSVTYKLSDKFFINLDRGEVNLDTRWFAERGYSKEQILWACLHELEHFRDLAEDPEGMKATFDYMRREGSKTGGQILKKWQDAYGQTDPRFIDKLKERPAPSKRNPRPMSQVEQVGYQIHHTFYNIFDDIFVNNGVRRRASTFADESGEHGGAARDLYEEKLFPLTDYAEHPRHLQFLYKLLREEMLPDQECVVSDDVEKALKKKIRFGGKVYTPREVVDDLLKPRGGRNTLAGRRAFILKKTLEPIFDDLLKKDIDDWSPKKPDEQPQQKPQQGESQGTSQEGAEQPENGNQPKPDESEEPQEEKEGDKAAGGENAEKQEDEDTEEQRGGGSEDDDEDEREESGPSKNESGNPFEDFYKKFDESNPDQLDPEQIQDWLDKMKEEAEKQKQEENKTDKEESKTAEQRTKETQEKADEEWRKENHISREQHEEVQKILKEVAPYLNELSQLWRRIVFGESAGVDIAMEGHFRTGSELDIGRVIEEFPQIKRGKLEETRVMRKMTVKEVKVERPELIRLRLVGDVSGSMSAEKRHVLKQCTALVLSSFQEFEYYLNVSRGKTRSKLHTDTEVWTFDSQEQKIKRFSEDLRGTNEQAEIVRSIAALDGGGGGTYDDAALNAIQRSLKPDEIGDIKASKTMEIVFEITDGGSSNQNGARSAVDTLSKNGLIVRAFQIGVVNQMEREAFNYVWNANRSEPWGQEVGSNIANLIPAITDALQKYLGNVRL